MSTYFLDTSSLVKRYIAELGSSWVLSWVEPAAGNVIIISELAYAEIHSTFARRIREGTLSAATAQTLKGDFLTHYQDDYLVIPIDRAIVTATVPLLETYSLRTLDAIQLTSAKESYNSFNEPITFVSADTNLLTAASAEGFSTDNPNNHP